ncbi:MAG: cation:proton antiporter [Nitrososphaeraceae archaeon]
MATEGSVAILHIVLTLGILLFASKLFAELFHRIKMPVVLGELLAGIIVGPFALGALPFFDGKPLVVLDETVLHIGELSAIVILFIAGLEITPREFMKGGAASFTVGSIGVIVPSLIFLKNKSKAMKVGIGMISIGEVGLIVAWVGVTSGALSTDIYTTLIIMVAVTTIVTPIWLKKSYEKELYDDDKNTAV